jgi:hypothetical protein
VSQQALSAQAATLSNVFVPGTAVYNNVLRVRRHEALSPTTWRMTKNQILSVVLTAVSVSGTSATAQWRITDYSVVYILPWPCKPGTWIRNAQTTTMTGRATLKNVSGKWLVSAYQAQFSPGSGP